MSDAVHARIESIAGAIALGEASDEERSVYREHIAVCRTCLAAFGGERELERVAATVTEARESEMWDPHVGDVVAARARQRSRRLQAGFGVAGLCLAVSLGAHAIVAAGVSHFAPSAGDPVVFNAGTTRIVLEDRSASTPKPAAPAPQPHRQLIVEHNVVQMARAPVQSDPAAAAAKPNAPPREIAALTVHPDVIAPPPKRAESDVPVWRRGAQSWRTVSKTTTTSLMESAPQTLTHNAELIQVNAPHTMRDAMPLGGATAINPQPPMIAYDEGANGTSVFEVLIDERGMPTKCVITKSAGYAVLDAAVCKAAMQARYAPKLIDGRAVPGVYRDAFTFRMDDDSEGVPKQIQ